MNVTWHDVKYWGPKCLYSLDNPNYFFLISYHYFRPKRTLNSKKYGVDLIHFTHATNTAIHSSTKVDGELKNVTALTMHNVVFVKLSMTLSLELLSRTIFTTNLGSAFPVESDIITCPSLHIEPAFMDHTDKYESIFHYYCLPPWLILLLLNCIFIFRHH